MSAKTFKWTVEIEVSEPEVADGLNLTSERITSALHRAWPYAVCDNVNARIVKAPSAESIAIAQGAYKRLGYCGDVMRDTYHVGVEIDGKRYLLCDRSNKYALPSDEELPEGATVCPECKRRDES